MKTIDFIPQLRQALELVQHHTTAMADKVLHVPFDYYRDSTYIERERETIWEWAPLALSTSVEIPNVNDYLVRVIFDKSILIVRGDDGQVRAFENYCRHRGANPADGQGNQRLFICPYHAWSYDTRGRLKAIPGNEGFTGVECSDYNLVALPCEERHGLIWVKLRAGSTMDVAGYLGSELDQELAIWKYADGSLFPEVKVDVNSNWKATIENFAETYHFTKVHGNSIPGEIQVHNTSTHEPFGLHYRQLFPFKTIGALSDIPEEEWRVLEHATVVYWIFPSLIVVNVYNVTQVIEVLPIDELNTCIRTISIGSGDPSDPAIAKMMEQTVEAARYALVEEDGPILNTLGQSIRHASHDHALVGRNEIGVQHVIKSISGRTGFPISGND